MEQNESNSAPSVSPQPFVQPQYPIARKPKKRLFIFGVIVVVLSMCVSFGSSWLAVTMFSGKTNQTNSLDKLVDSSGKTAVTANEEIISSVAEKVAPSVVSILTSTSSRGGSATSAGTGVIVSKDGYIMTNNHVTQGAKSISVITSDGTTYSDVTLIGNDPLNDIAFIKISGVNNLTPATLGNSSDLRIGQQVVAIGNALGEFQNTVTSGIVSAKGRPLTASSSDGGSSESLTDLIQTDAAINSGNSGGPLVDLSGRVIGINTAVATDANGIGFAIPINATLGVLKGIIEKGEISRAYLGVRYVEITPSVASEYDLTARKGAYVYADGGSSAVIANGPAAKAGIKDKDIITKVNGAIVGDAGSMSSLIGQYRPGETVQLTVLREGKEQTVAATLAAYQGSGD